MRTFSIPAVVVLIGITSGCHPLNDPVNDYHPPLEIRYFSVIAAPGATASDYDSAPITPYVDSGNFQIRWEVATAGAYQIDLYVSNDLRLGSQGSSGREDVHFKQFYRAISDTANHELYRDTVTLNCQFTTGNILSCGRITYENPGRDITSFLTELPKPAYLILRACDDELQTCTTTALNVEFQ